MPGEEDTSRGAEPSALAVVGATLAGLVASYGEHMAPLLGALPAPQQAALAKLASEAGR